MRRGLTAVLVLAVSGALTTVACGQGEFELQYHRFKQALPVGFRSAQEFLPARPGPPPGVTVPKLEGRAVYFSHTIGGREILLLVDAGKNPRLYVDADGDKDLAEEGAVGGSGPRRSGGLLAALAGGGDDAEIVFGPVTVPGKAPGGDVEFRIRSFPGDNSFQYVFVEPAGLRTGVVALAGRNYRMRVLDANLDGRYDGVLNPTDPYSVDWLELVPEGRASRTAGSQPQPLPRLVKVRDAWYALRIDPAGESAGIEATEPAFGTLDVGDEGVGLTLLSDTGLHQLRGSGGKWQLPEGRYGARQVTLSRKDEKQQTWVLSAYGDTGKLSDFTIGEGETTTLKLGPPLIVKTEATFYAEGQAQLGLQILGQAGEEYAPGATKNGRRVDAPTYRIFDADGKLLSSGRFAYG
jgi:hypothetical protein